MLNFDSCVTLTPERAVSKYYAGLIKNLVYQNPLSATRISDKIAGLLETARKDFANLIGARPAEIIFTSSGSEANNLAIKGFLAANPSRPKGVLTTFYEHSSVMAPIKSAAGNGYKFARASCAEIAESAHEKTNLMPHGAALAAFVMASGETGEAFPIKEMTAAARACEIAVHCDACLTAGRISIDAGSLGVDMMSVSAHKFGGPAGVGALYVRPGTRLFPLIEGGVEERGLRAGFYNVPAIAAAGLAARMALESMDERNAALKKLKLILCDEINKRIKGVKWVAGPDSPLNFYASFILPATNAENLISRLSNSNILVSPYSWCVSAAKTPDSLIHKGIEEYEAAGYMRICLSHHNTEKEISRLAGKIANFIR
ncbi:MAG TPA: aminotransferase class V-fold PLP-dependent enzyme [Candidatus Wallbacteria bacterium]|nr:aminotransferase class V-fold PLP-dependent enzyme [Candidatus Wallbacteria bacterium]